MRSMRVRADGTKMTYLSVELTLEMYEELTERAKAQGCSLSYLIRKYLIEGLDGER